MDNVAISVWQPIPSKQFKMEQILSLKTAQEKPSLKSFATQYSEVMGEIRAGEGKLSQLAESSQSQIFGVNDITTVLESHKEALAREITSCSQGFENILNETVGTEMVDLGTGSNSESRTLILVARIVCWLRLVSIILNPPPSAEKLELVHSFAESARTKAQNYISEHIASLTGSLAKRLLSSRRWTDKVPEQSLWEGITPSRRISDVKGEPGIPVQPTRIPIQLIKEITSQLNSLGIELLSRDFVLDTMKSCRDTIASAYNDVLMEISEDAALQLLADISFLEIALSVQEMGEFKQVKEKLCEKVTVSLVLIDFSVLMEFWKNSCLR